MPGYFRNSDAQFCTTVIPRIAADSGGGTTITNLFPSGNTSNPSVTVAPSFVAENNNCGVPSDSASCVCTATTKKLFVAGSRKNSSRPSRLHRGAPPPFTDTCHLPAPVGNGRT